MTSYIQLSQIPTANDLYAAGHLNPASNAELSVTSTHTDKICLIRGDITLLVVDAIVNAANSSLLGGGGVDGAIHDAAGPSLLRACSGLGGCATGSAKITDAFDLPNKKVIHAVGPIYKLRSADEPTSQEHLKSCYATCLDLAYQYGLKTIAFCAISTGIYGYPSDEAAEVALGAVKSWLDADAERAAKIDKIVFCNFMVKDEVAYHHYLPHFFPPATSQNDGNEDDETKGDDKINESDVNIVDDDSAEPPSLPDVPTQEPTSSDEPQLKKRKTNAEATAVEVYITDATTAETTTTAEADATAAEVAATKEATVQTK